MITYRHTNQWERLCIFLQMLLYKCKELPTVYFWKEKSTIAPASPLLIYALHNKRCVNEVANILGIGTLQGLVSAELSPPHSKLLSYLRRQPSPVPVQIFAQILRFVYFVTYVWRGVESPNDQTHRLVPTSETEREGGIQ
jgi:hypothetical protein